ncbi:MAG: type II toxin-antitoxin system VapC family toxin [Caulobacterales bacterium]
MAHLIDTNVAIHVRDGVHELIDKIEALGGPVLMSIVTRVELEGGVYREPSLSSQRRAALDLMFRAIRVLVFDDEAAGAYANIVKHAGYSRRKLLDRMIAAQAIVHRATLVTMNQDDFADIPGLKLLSW